MQRLWQWTGEEEAEFLFNSPLWRRHELDGPCLALLDNDDMDETGGKVALFGDPSWTDVTVTAEMRFLRGRMPGRPRLGWFGLALRAQDPQNFELFWLIPEHSGEVGAVSYVPVAHGVVPWWTEAYSCQTHGKAPVPADAWIPVRAEVVGRTARIFVSGELALEKTLTYYLDRGRVGFYVGTGTDAAFRRIRVEARGG